MMIHATTRGGARIAGCFLAAVLGLSAAFAQTDPADIKGSRDHPTVGRYEGSVIVGFYERGYDEITLPVRPVTDADRSPGGPRLNEKNSLALAGKAVRIQYRGPAGRSPLEVVRNFEQKLKAQGFEILFLCRASECGGSGGDLWLSVRDATSAGRAFMSSNFDSQVYAIAKQARPEGDVHVAILSVRSGNAIQTSIDVIEGKPMETDKIVFVDANAMRASIAKSGKVALYGILFDFDKADLKPESKPTLDEIAAFLKADPQVEIVVAGHTDNRGSYDYNLDLSKRRAAAVVAALVKTYGVAPRRLTPFGAGMAAPVGSNDSDAGRAQNRRVELVKR